MSEEELRAGSITNRNTGSLFGHNTMNYERLLNNGLKSVIEECDRHLNLANITNKAAKLETDEQLNDLIDSGELSDMYEDRTHNEFYKGVKIACKAVIRYANNYADIAEAEAALQQDVPRKNELIEMARIARKVPENPAETFHEAMQSITFFHIALHASMNFISLGRLDQVLSQYINETTLNKDQEIFECFLIKLAGRLNLSSKYLMEQDHVDYATVLGTHAYYIDQKAGVNNFLQNIIIGGKTPELLKEKIASCIQTTGNNPAILNDEVMIPALHQALMQDELPKENNVTYEETLRLANDYCVDGCWEPILNGNSDWTFSMPNIMVAMESAMNNGASLSPDMELFRGAKVSPYTPVPQNYEDLLKCFETHLQFITDQCVMSTFIYYGIDEYAAPSPLLSAFMGGCMKNGRDKAWAGADYNLGGVIYGGIPNVVNTMAALKKWVYDKKKYTIELVCDAFRNNYICVDPTQKKIQEQYNAIIVDFNTNPPKFGNNDPIADEITKKVCDLCYDTAMKSAKFGKRVFQEPVSSDEWTNIIALRNLAGYYGTSLSNKYEKFKMKITVGMGTFEQYNWQGRGIAASADRRSGEPLAPNFSPKPGTTQQGVIGLFESFSKLGMERFAGGVITDICLEADNTDKTVIKNLLNLSLEKQVPMYTISIGSKNLYREIYETVLAANSMSNKDEAANILAPYAGVNVRIGGWQTPFITLPISHMKNYIQRPVGYQEIQATD